MVITERQQQQQLRDSVHKLDARGTRFEARVYDLRALTSYTFRVRVARFARGSQPTDAQQQVAASGGQLDRQWAATSSGERRQRELDDASSSSLRVETKPFGAEASKCLADSSEVLVRTGRFFGGRIAVENSVDPRCSIVGNRSSEQEVYLLRVPHGLCHSRVVDGNRVETMILVHENKDILTHNTARFLVQCNFEQKSFTLRASVSLPKVNALLGSVSTTSSSSSLNAPRPALITSLAGRPSVGGDMGASAPVTLGSMRGVYRARPTTNEPASSSSTPASIVRTERPSGNDISNTIEGSSRTQVGEWKRHTSVSEGEMRARALGFEPHASVPPAPVQVRSPMLQFERAEVAPARAARLHWQGERIEGPARLITASMSVGGGQASFPTTSVVGHNNDNDDDDDVVITDEPSIKPQQQPLILTNNHRVGANFLRSIATHQARAMPLDDFSIKYSTAHVDDFAVGPVLRSARAEPDAANNATEWELRRRLGELPSDPIDSAAVDSDVAGEDVAHTRNPLLSGVTALQAPNATLAHNLTNYLLMWSLRKLTNLARKSLDALIKTNETSASTVGDAQETPQRLGDVEQLDQPTRAAVEQRHSAPQPSTSAFVNSASIATTPQLSSTSSATTTTTTTTASSISTTNSAPTRAPIASTTTTTTTTTAAAATAAATVAQRKHDTVSRNASVARAAERLGRPSNYSKSLDLSRIEAQQAAAAAAAASKQQRAVIGSQKQTNGSRNDAQPASELSSGGARARASSMWIAGALAIIGALLTGVTIAAWMLMGFARRSARHSSDRQFSDSALIFATSSSPLSEGGSVGGASSNGGCSDALASSGNFRPADMSYREFNDATYDKHNSQQQQQQQHGDKLVRCANTTHNVNGLLSPAPSIGSAAGCSANASASSNSSTLLAADEHDCKNNEFIFTEHVLLGGESYA